jgi:signal transduction histidine kinase
MPGRPALWQRLWPGGDDPAIRKAQRRFLGLSASALAVVAAAVVLVSQHVAEEEARRDAASRATGIAQGVAGPFVDQRVRDGRPRALAHLTRVLDARIAEGGLTHVVLWSADGRILWADTASLVGQQSTPSSGAVEALRTMDSVVHLPDEREEEAEQRQYGEEGQLEVYVGIRDVDGVPLVFEAYLPPDRIAIDRAAVLPQLLTVGLGSLLLFQLALVPIAWLLVRRVDDAQRARHRMLTQSAATWGHQRRVLAQDLHDGVIQDLAAIGYGLSAIEARVSQEPDLGNITGRLREAVGHAEEALRTMVLDLIPPDLGGDGLAMAVEDLGQRPRAAGLDVTIDVPDRLPCSETTLRLAYQVVREGLRNVDKHATASRVTVRVLEHESGLLVEVVDDGRGPVADGGTVPAHGHGLALLGSALADAGGWLRLEPAEGGGTALRAGVPLLTDTGPETWEGTGVAETVSGPPSGTHRAAH